MTQNSISAGPAIILVEPQLGENIGTTARAMLNCGLTDLRLVRPRDGWPNPKAESAAAGATAVLEAVRIFSTTAEAVADLTHMWATTARTRDMARTVMTPRAAAADMRRLAGEEKACGVLFGPERTGLHNDDLALADRTLTVPLNPGFTSLNLAQAVLLIGYEWFQAGDSTPGSVFRSGSSPLATRDHMVNLFEHLESALDAAEFFSTPEKRPGMVRNIRNALLRMEPTEQEVRTFHGIIAALAGTRSGKKT
ncbi:MAG: RNA methyltransferase [Pseudomonadota bacterium]|nr:RNA methyltransferase [Pseudomonadota bacterium]